MQKTLFFILSFTLCSVTAKCQLDKKTWLVGGSGSFYSYNETQTISANTLFFKNSNIEVSPSIGYFFMDKLALGIRQTLMWQKSDFIRSAGNVSGGYSNQLKYNVGPFGRYYFLDKEKPFNLFTEINYQFGINKFITSNSKGKFNQFSTNAGTVIFFNSSVGLEILLGYKTTTESIDSPSPDYNINRKGFQMAIGFQIHLENK